MLKVHSNRIAQVVYAFTALLFSRTNFAAPAIFRYTISPDMQDVGIAAILPMHVFARWVVLRENALQNPFLND